MMTPDIENIPQELRDRDQWVLWKAVEKTNGSGVAKITKVPYSAITPETPRKASVTNPQHWSSFDQVANALILEDGYDGIGFVFTKNDPYVGVDFDNCIDEHGVIDPEVQQAIHQLDSYTEISVSGRGIHSIPRGALKGAGHCDTRRGFEMYDHSRYFTFTGKPLNGFSKLQDRQDQIDELYTRWFGEDAYRRRYTAADYVFDKSAEVSELEDFNLAPEMTELIHTGEGMSLYDDDRSRALYPAVWSLMAAGANNESVLPILTDTEHFLSGAALAEHRRNGNVESGRQWLWKYVVSQMRQHYDEEMAYFEQLDDADHDTNGVESKKQPAMYGKDPYFNARQFLSRDTRMIRYGERTYIYTGKYWKPVSNEYADAKVFTTLGPMGLSMAVMNNTMRAVRLLANIETLTPPANMLAFNNGLLDVTGWGREPISTKLRPFSHRYHFTSIMEYDYDPSATCPQWLAFLGSSLEGDADWIAMLQEFMGWCLIYDYQYHKMFLLLGKSRAGKSLIINILSALVGEEATTATDLRSLVGAFGLEGLQHAKVATIPDAQQTEKRLITRAKEVLLTIIGHDYIAVNRKGITEIPMRIPARLVVSANQMPRFYDQADALLNRSLVLRFNKSFYGSEDIQLESKLKSELPGILNWALDGLFRLGKQRGFTEGELSKQGKKSMQVDQNSVGSFATCFLIEDPDGRVPVDQCFEGYRAFCEENDTDAETKRYFNRHLQELFPHLSKGRIPPTVDENRPRAYLGTRFKQPDFDQFIAEHEFD